MSDHVLKNVSTLCPCRDLSIVRAMRRQAHKGGPLTYNMNMLAKVGHEAIKRLNIRMFKPRPHLYFAMKAL
jgi:hypothetical protein